MRVVIAGGHGQVARHLERMLVGGGNTAVGLVRNVEHFDDLRAVGAEPVLCDLERSAPGDVAAHLAGADAVVFAAGAGPGSGIPRKDTVDRAAACLLADAAEQAGVQRFVQVSSMGAGREPPDGTSEVFAAYLRAKTSAEQDLRARDLAWTILRPGGLTDGQGSGRVTLAPSVERGRVPRADVAAVLLALLYEPRTAGLTLELTSGQTSVADAVAALRA